MNNENKSIKKIAATAAICVASAAIIATTALSAIGLAISQKKFDELEDKVSKLSSSSDVAGVNSALGALATSDALAGVNDALGALATSDEIAALGTTIGSLATSDALAGIGNKIDSLATSEEIADLTEALFPTQDGPLAANYGEEAYEKLVYIDKMLHNRDCLSGEQFKLAQKWIIYQLMGAGYVEGVDIVKQDTTMTKYIKKLDSKKAYTQAYPACESIDISEKTYNRSGRNYVEAEGDTGAYVQAVFHTSNIIVTKEGKSDKTIIVGAHYDGNGSGDNGSSIALAVTTAQHLFDVETEYTIKFVFFTAEEYGMYGSSAFVNAMTEEEIANTLYMINMDSLGCGDYCYIYGGVQDDENQTVNKTEAYDNAMALAEAAGIELKSNPWTWENPAPGYEEVGPDYASPSTGDWSDHVPFKKAGISYLYFEATNWEIPGPYYEYDGYGETYLVGMIMNTDNDYLEYIESYFPGRPLHHLTQFSTLLNLLLTQSDYAAE